MGHADFQNQWHNLEHPGSTGVIRPLPELEHQFLEDLYQETEPENWENDDGWDARHDIPQGCHGLEVVKYYEAVAMPDDGVLRARDGSIIEMGKAGMPKRWCTQNQYEASQREAKNERLRILNEHGIWGTL